MDKLNLLETTLGKHIKGNRDYVQFRCPFCNHPKHKLGISLNRGNWKCWVCGTKGGNVPKLLYKIKTTPKLIQSAMSLWKVKINEPVPTTNTQIEFPDKAFPLYIERNSIFYQQAFNYMKGRGFTLNELMKHNIHYFEDGQYHGYIMFPSYNKFGQLNYYSLRAYIPTKHPHLIPPFDKNIIFDENQINWNADLILVESKINAMTIRRNAVMMGGKVPSNKLKQKILESQCEKITICLDGDAYNDIIPIAQYLIDHGKRVFRCKLPYEADANSLGYTKIWEIINTATEITNQDVFKENILCRLKK